MKRRAIILAALLCGVGLPAHATEWINCASTDGKAKLAFLVGTIDALSITGLTLSAGQASWSSAAAYGPGTPVHVGQAYEDSETIRIDAMDESFAFRVAELRLFKTGEGDGEVVIAGTLRIPDHGAWAVTCSGP